MRVDRVAKIALISSSVAMTLLVMVRTGKWNTVEALLSIFSSLVGKSLGPSGNRRLLSWYTAWLLLIGFILTSYLNILQSIVVVPSVRLNDRTFEEMLREDFAFETFYSSIKWMQIYSPALAGAGVSTGNGGRGRRPKILETEKQLVQRISEYKQKVPFSWHTHILTFSEGQRKVFVLDNLELEYQKSIPAESGWSLMIGNERFFNAPRWWSFSHVERGSLLAQSVESMKAVGLMPYFLRLFDSKVRQYYAAEAHRDFVAAGEFDELLEHKSEVSLDDGLVSESFVLFLYGISIAVAAFACEVIAKLLTSRIVALRNIVPVL